MVGGGLRSTGDMRRMLEAGADKISVNTAAVQRPELAREAGERLRRLGYPGVQVRSGDGYYGWEEKAPFGPGAALENRPPFG